MPALEHQLAADGRAFVLVVQLIRFKIQRRQQRGDIGIVPHQQRDFRRFRRVAHQRVIDIFHQRFSHVARHFRRGEETVLIAVFQLRQHLPLLIAVNFTPRHLVFRETFIILQRKGVNQRVADFKRPGNARLLLIFSAKGIFRVAQRALLLLFTGRGVTVVGHLLQQLIAFAQLHPLPLFLHRLYGLFAEGGGIIGDHRIKRRVHGAHFFLMMYGHAAAGERAGDKELRGGDGTLQAIGIGVDRVLRRAFAAGHHSLLRQPFAHIVPHVDFQHSALGGQLSTGDIPLWPGLWRGLLQHAAVVRQRRAQVMAAHDQHLLKLVPFRCGRFLRLNASGQ